MPPGPAFNWYCVLSTAADIVSHAAKYRATQLTRYPKPSSTTVNHNVSYNYGPPLRELVIEKRIYESPIDSSAQEAKAEFSSTKKDWEAVPEPDSNKSIHEVEESVPQVTKRESHDHSQEPTPQIPTAVRNLQSSKVPSSRIGRLLHYGGLASSLAYGAASEAVRRVGGNNEHAPSLMFTESNVKRLVSKLSQMRGAALKLGQFLSIQDSHTLPPEIDKIFRRVQDSAHYMPDWQMEEVMQKSLGPKWISFFESFERVPFAAASIGQVHSALLTAEHSPTGRPAQVAVKIQFPNIASSISSDLSYVNFLLTAGRMLPRGLFLERTMAVMKEELADECDYSREAHFARKFARDDFLGSDPRYNVPWVWDQSTRDVLVMEMVEGLSVGELHSSSQSVRNEVASSIITLCMKELFQLRTMQTDPNWTNFLWNPKTHQINLIDFGATREYSGEFINNWFRLLQAAADDDRDSCLHWSLQVGYLTGEENEAMLNAHVTSMSLLATPFKRTTAQPFAFAGQEWKESSQRIREFIPVMLQERLTPPPRETYSLNRKLSGAFLLASKLGAVVDTGKIWEEFSTHRI